MDAPFQVRRAVADDAEALTDLHLDCWDDAYTGMVPQHVIDGRRAQRDQRIVSWGDYLQRNPTWLAVEEDHGDLVGFATAGAGRDTSYDGPRLELMSLYCRSRVWGHGVGHALLTTAIGDEPAYLWVLLANARAIGFYERHGFVLDGTEKDCVEGIDARMVRT